MSCQMVDLSVESARAALLHPEVQSIITTETVDVVVTLPGREGLVTLCSVLRQGNDLNNVWLFVYDGVTECPSL